MQPITKYLEHYPIIKALTKPLHLLENILINYGIKKSINKVDIICALNFKLIIIIVNVSTLHILETSRSENVVISLNFDFVFI